MLLAPLAHSSIHHPAVAKFALEVEYLMLLPTLASVLPTIPISMVHNVLSAMPQLIGTMHPNLVMCVKAMHFSIRLLQNVRIALLISLSCKEDPAQHVLLVQIIAQLQEYVYNALTTRSSTLTLQSAWCRLMPLSQCLTALLAPNSTLPSTSACAPLIDPSMMVLFV